MVNGTRQMVGSNSFAVNRAIVRSLKVIGTIDGRGNLEERLAMKLGPQMGVAAFLQDRETRRIYAAVTTAASRL